jgi:hypothetical protein
MRLIPALARLTLAFLFTFLSLLPLAEGAYSQSEPKPEGGGVNVVLKGRIARYRQNCGYTPEAAAKEAAKYSGHSGRVGMYTAASEAGVAIDAVATLARHKSLNVAQKYARNADQLKRAPSKNPALAI